jgi:poly(hydroxyalkanoate) depolymerase family esterase
MTDDFADAMRRALAQTRAQDPNQATATIMAALSGRPQPWNPSDERRTAPPTAALVEPTGRVIEGDFRAIETGAHPKPADASPATPSRKRQPLSAVVNQRRKTKAKGCMMTMPGLLPGLQTGRSRTAGPPIAVGARFVDRHFACAAGARPYQLYIPGHHAAAPRGLIVMLHGCTQNALDFANGTSMNAVAERHGLLVAYPTQTAADNPSSCWNWFRPGDQRRDAGEPAILAGLTRAVAEEFGLTHELVFVAGLSAGGAMAAILVETYPELFAAVGVHSGLPSGSAHDVVSAFAAMRGDGMPARRAGSPIDGGGQPPMIIFHGSADRTVHPANAERLAAAALAGSPARRAVRSEGHTAGRDHRTTFTLSEDGAPMVEHWLIEGAGHAWSGGHASGSYTDPSGPDASAEMVRFFLQTLGEDSFI